LRALASRDLLRGNRGDYRFSGVVNSIAVPATVQAVSPRAWTGWTVA